LGLSVSDAAQLRRQLKQEIAVGNGGDTAQALRQSQREEHSLLWTVHDAVRAEADALVLEVGLCLRYCSTTFGCPQIKSATLTGSEACDPTLAYLLSERLGVHARPGRPLQMMERSGCAVFADRRNPMSDWSVCAGLATWMHAPSYAPNVTMVPDAARLQESVG
jgi:hypothetical protein